MRRWEAYEAFVAVIETGSFTAAAERLRLSKSAVSRIISGLEDRLGSQLLFRTTRKIAPTDLGKAVYQRCVEAFGDLESIDLEAMEHDATPRGRLRMVASDAFGEIYVAPLVAEMMTIHDKLEVELLITDRTVDIVGEGFDLAIRYNSLVDSSLRVQKLFELPHVCAASPAYLERAGIPVRPVDLVDHNCLVSTFEPCTSWRFKGDDPNKTLALTGSWCCNNGPSLMVGALKSVGIVWLPELYLRPYLQDGSLVQLLSDYRAKEAMPVWCVYPTRRHATAKVRAVIDYLKERLPSLNAR